MERIEPDATPQGVKIEVEKTGAWTWRVSVNGRYMGHAVWRQVRISKDIGSSYVINLGDMNFYPANREGEEWAAGRRIIEEGAREQFLIG